MHDQAINRLIIIGNGFDLAHGYKTRFSDFFEWYIYDSFKKFKNKDFHDELITILPNKSVPDYQKKDADFKSFVDVTKDSAFKLWTHIISGSNTYFEGKYNDKDSLLYSLLADFENSQWVDIEMRYFKKLTASATDHSKVSDLNRQFSIIRNKFLEYMKIEVSKVSLQTKDMRNTILQMSELFKDDDFSLESIDKKTAPQSILILNFNYTQVAELYVDLVMNELNSKIIGIANSQNIEPIKREVAINYIHGDLKENHAKPIFGYGDEMDVDYLKFEDKGNNKLFEHMKSFKYLESRNYFKLLAFIESIPFQVQVFGHSCGLSDRTMLNTIFEHDNCQSIKLFYHKREDNSDDFTEKTYEISRHFVDKAKLRARLVPKGKRNFMHQINQKE